MSGSVESKIFMVSVDSNDVRGGQEDVPPSVELMDNRKKLSVVNVIVPFRLVKGMGYTSNGLKSSSVVFL